MIQACYIYCALYFYCFTPAPPQILGHETSEVGDPSVREQGVDFSALLPSPPGPGPYHGHFLVAILSVFHIDQTLFSKPMWHTIPSLQVLPTPGDRNHHHNWGNTGGAFLDPCGWRAARLAQSVLIDTWWWFKFPQTPWRQERSATWLPLSTAPSPAGNPGTQQSLSKYWMDWRSSSLFSSKNPELGQWMYIRILK